MQSILQKKHLKIILFFLAVASILTLFTHLFFLSNLNHYEAVNLKSVGTFINNRSLYTDLNNDGNSEKLIFGQDTLSGVYFVVVKNSNGTYREQYNLKNPILDASTYSFDLNNDDYKELIIYSKSDSALNVSIIDVTKNIFIRNETPIFYKPDKILNDVWDLKQVVAKYADLNKDGRLEAYLSFLTAHAVHPRGLYKYDLSTFELLKSFPTTAPIHDFKFSDYEKDGKTEILVKASSSGNTRDRKGIHDQHNWFIMLDENLNFLHEPKIFGEFLTALKFEIIKDNNDRECILMFFANNKNSNPPDALYLYDFDLNMILKREFSLDYFQSFAVPPVENIKRFYVTTSEGEIVEFDNNLSVVKSRKIINTFVNFISIGDYCSAEGYEIILWDGNSVLILSSEFDLLYSYQIDSSVINFSVNRRFDEPYPSLYFDTENKTIEFKLEPNLLAKLNIPITILLFVIYFVIIYSLHRIFSRITRVIGAYNYSYDDVNLGIIITDHEGKIKSYNKSIINNLSLDASIQKNKNIFTIFKQTSELTNVISEAFKVEKEVSRDIAFTKNNFRFIGKIQVLPLFTLFRVPHSFVIKIQNLTKEIEGDRSKIWSRIAQKVAHDIKTPLSTIQLNLTALKRRISESPIADKSPLNDDIEMIHEEIRQISELTKSFLKFSSLEKPNLQWTDINTLIENSIKPFKKYFDDGIKFEYEIQDDLHSVWVDPNQMVQLFHIFVENAIDAITSDGLIKITVNLVDDLQHAGGSHVEFLITDNGKGLTGEEKNKIFEPYFTQKKDGTGMGLTIAKKIVEDHGGTIDVQTKVRFGTTFIIKLPHNQPENDA